MWLQKAKSSNLAANNFSVWLRCDVLAHRSTNSPRRSPQGGLLMLLFLPTKPVSRKNVEIGKYSPGVRSAECGVRRAEHWGVGRRFAALQRGDCTVGFACLLASYFRIQRLHRDQNFIRKLFQILHLYVI